MPIKPETCYYVYCDGEGCEAVYGESNRYPTETFSSNAEAVNALVESCYYGDEEDRWFYDDGTQPILCPECRRKPHAFVADIPDGHFEDLCMRCEVAQGDHAWPHSTMSSSI